jgi:hypothetical protein
MYVCWRALTGPRLMAINRALQTLRLLHPLAPTGQKMTGRD